MGKPSKSKFCKKNSNPVKSCPKAVKIELKDEIIFKKNFSSKNAVDFDGFFQLFVMN